MSDQTTVGYTADVELRAVDELPIVAVDPNTLDIEGVDVLGSARVENADKHGGVWSLQLDAHFPTRALSIAEVDERLEPGTYALVRVEGDDA